MSIWTIKHITSIHNYVKKFSALMLEITNMSEEHLLFNFIDGLKLKVAHELKHRGINDISTALIVAKSLNELEYHKSNNFQNSNFLRIIIKNVRKQRGLSPHNTRSE